MAVYSPGGSGGATGASTDVGDGGGGDGGNGGGDGGVGRGCGVGVGSKVAGGSGGGGDCGAEACDASCAGRPLILVVGTCTKGTVSRSARDIARMVSDLVSHVYTTRTLKAAEYAPFRPINLG